MRAIAENPELVDLLTAVFQPHSRHTVDHSFYGFRAAHYTLPPRRSTSLDPHEHYIAK